MIYLVYRVPCTVWFASVTRKGIRPANVDLTALGVSLKGSITSFGALRLECDQPQRSIAKNMLVLKWRSTKDYNWILEVRCFRTYFHGYWRSIRLEPSVVTFSPLLHCIQSVPPVTDRLYYITISRAMINHNSCALASEVF